MEKSVEILIDATSDYGWNGGEAFADHLSRAATYSKDSIAVDPFRSPGLITSGPGFANLAFNTVAHMTAMLRYMPNSRRGFGLDRLGNFLLLDLANLNACYLRALTASQITNEDIGLEIHKDAAYVAYNLNASTAYLSKFSPLSNLPSATWNVSFNVSLTANALNTAGNSADTQCKHPLVSWRGRLYAMHGNKVDYTDGSTGVLTVGCQLPENFVIKCAVPHKNQIAIGASSNLIDPTYLGGPRVYFWDGTSTDWDTDVEFPDTDITCLETFGGNLFGFGPNGIYQYDGNGFVRIEDTNGISVPHRGTDVFDGRLWFKGANVIRGYGRPSVRNGDPAFTSISTGVGGNAKGLVRFVTKSRILVPIYDSAQVYDFEAATNETSAKFVTRWFGQKEMLGRKFRVASVQANYEGLGVSGTSATVSVIDALGNTKNIFTVSNPSDATDHPFSKEVPAAQFSTGVPDTTKMKLSVTFTNGRMSFNSFRVLLEALPTQS